MDGNYIMYTTPVDLPLFRYSIDLVLGEKSSAFYLAFSVVRKYFLFPNIPRQHRFVPTESSPIDYNLLWC
jgi:hypothetical protein